MPTNYEKLKTLLRELFQMDQADLDFGLYRIMNAKREEIERFLEHDLLPQVKTELARHTGLDSGAKKAELDKAIENATRLGANPDDMPMVQQLREELRHGTDLEVLENEVFSHLCNFFRRYYDQGDFLSLRRYKEGVYAIPYEGEEVKLYWANHDQYYIKSTEYLRNYTFKLRDGRRVHFKVVEADADVDNNKPQTGKERRFSLAEAHPVAVENGDLCIRFNYQTDTRKQAELNTAAVTALLGNASLTDWLSALGELRPTEKNPQRTLLAKHLNDFTARYAFDYFIHKDLGGFLRRELDFFIKNEIMHLDDVEDETAPKVQLYLSKIKALRKIAHKVIAFLEQLENFQKRMWLKKKFVVETNYCVTLDRVPEELYPQIIDNKAQIEEWKRLFAIQEIERGTVNPGYSEPLTSEFLKANPTLVLDTKHFTNSFREVLCQSIQDFDNQCGGVLLNADNFQALSLSQRRWAGAFRCAYIDPPYNTGGGDFAYKDSYQHSSWMCMMRDRLSLTCQFLDDDGDIFVNIDDNEQAHLKLLMDGVFGKDDFLANAVWQKAYSPRMDAKEFSSDVDHILIYGGGACRIPFEQEDGQFNHTDATTGLKYRRRSWRKEGSQSRRQDRPNLFYEVGAPDQSLLWPIRPDGSEGRWRGGKEKYDALNAQGLIEWVKTERGWQVYVKQVYDANATQPPSTLWRHEDAGHNHEAAETIKALFGANVFENPKPVRLIKHVLAIAGSKDCDLTLDFFGGSGTTAQAVIEVNREDELKMKFVLVEMGTHFDSVLLPRIKKVIYSADWQEGKPVSRQGSSYLFKYIRLESYDDCLNNLELKRTKTQDDLLTQAKDFREDYTLRYMLDVEARGSASLLNVQKFTDPFSYKLNVSTGTVGETKEVNVDLVETFNWLIGLTVKHIDHIHAVRVVEGTSPEGDRVLILWRNVAEVPNDKLDEWFKTQGYNTRDQEYDLIYVNGDNNLENLRRGDQTWKVRLIEEDFHQLMWECQDV
jgi:adenine-specific DNA-methyltransferase